jgi:hypothetical protein
MLKFFGFDLELAVEAILARGQAPTLCQARDLTGGPWLIVQTDDDPAHLAWLCAPVSERVMKAVVDGEALPWDAVSHSATGTVELVLVDHGRAVPDRCLLCSDLTEHLQPSAELPVRTPTSVPADPALPLDIEVAPNTELVTS